jgi:hypothetical protein
VLAKNWRFFTQLAASACEVCMRLAASRMNLHATDGHSGTICMRLVATRLQDKRQADKRCVKGHLYIIIIFFIIGRSTSSTMLLTIQLTALVYLVWKMRWYYG